MSSCISWGSCRTAGGAPLSFPLIWRTAGGAHSEPDAKPDDRTDVISGSGADGGTNTSTDPGATNASDNVRANTSTDPGTNTGSVLHYSNQWGVLLQPVRVSGGRLFG